MIGPKSTTKMMVTCSTQVTLESIARELADCEGKAPCGYRMEKEEAVKVDLAAWTQVVGRKKRPTPLLSPKKQEKSNVFLNRKSSKQINLEEVQRKALESRKRIDSIKNEKSSSPQRRSRNATTKEIKSIDSKIREAHQNPWYLDLHYMSVEGAVNLVKEAIEAAQYLMRSNRRRSSTRIKIITGSGNNSRKGPKIRPEIETFLRNNKISYDFVNSGCFLIKLD